mgnify:CR=1 FL=1
MDIVKKDIIGYVCKKSETKSTALGRKFAFIVIKTDDGYISCECTGSYAKTFSALKVGDCVRINGKIHTRTITRIYNHQVFERKVQELSVLGIEKI